MASHLAARSRVVATMAAVLVLAPVAAARPAAPESASPAGSLAYVDPALLAEVAAGPAPAILTWDDRRATRAQVGSHLESRGVEHHVFSHLDMAVGCASGPGDVAALAGAPGAVSVWADEPMTPTLDQSVPTAFNGDPAEIWSVEGATGKGVGIAVLDTGIDATHPDLAFGSRTKLNARVVFSHFELLGPGSDSCIPDSYQEDLEDSETASGHGTHLASVAAGDGTASDGTLKGMAPEADLVGVAVVGQTTPQHGGDLGGVRISLVRFIAGVNYVLQRALEGGPTVVKVALLGWTSDRLFDAWHPHTFAVRDLYDFGISVVMPVGNEGPDQSACDSGDTCHFNGLAVGPFPIAVGATPKDSRTSLEDYSSRGDPTPRESRGALYSYEPTLVAPGSGVVAARRLGLVTFDPPLPNEYPLGAGGEGVGDDPTNTDYQALTGTSVAAAHVAGAIAVMQQGALEAKGCFLTSDQVKEVLTQTATPVGDRASWEVGAGALDATAAYWGAVFAEKVTTSEPWVCPPGGSGT